MDKISKQLVQSLPLDKLGGLGTQLQGLTGGVPMAGSPMGGGGGQIEKISCEIRIWFKLFLGILLFICILILLPVVPFIWISYSSFYGKYGIVKILKSINKEF